MPPTSDRPTVAEYTRLLELAAETSGLTATCPLDESKEYHARADEALRQYLAYDEKIKVYALALLMELEAEKTARAASEARERRLRAAFEPQPMETAPKDGTTVILLGWPGQAHGMCLAFWEECHERDEFRGVDVDHSGWLYDDFRQGPISEDNWTPTGWLFLPERAVREQGVQEAGS